MEPGTHPTPHDDDEHPTTEDIDEKYAEVDPEDVTENAIDYFQGDPETESEKAERREREDADDGRTT